MFGHQRNDADLGHRTVRRVEDGGNLYLGAHAPNPDDPEGLQVEGIVRSPKENGDPRTPDSSRLR